jgi:hypothetical protein
VPAGHRPADRVVAADAADTVGAGGRG